MNANLRCLNERLSNISCQIGQHYDGVIMGAIASQITSLDIVYSTVYSGANQSIHQSSASLAFVWGIHRGFPAQMASNAENVSIWWRHHAKWCAPWTINHQTLQELCYGPCWNFVWVHKFWKVLQSNGLHHGIIFMLFDLRCFRNVHPGICVLFYHFCQYLPPIISDIGQSTRLTNNFHICQYSHA